MTILTTTGFLLVMALTRVVSASGVIYLQNQNFATIPDNVNSFSLQAVYVEKDSSCLEIRTSFPWSTGKAEALAEDLLLTQDVKDHPEDLTLVKPKHWLTMPLSYRFNVAAVYGTDVTIKTKSQRMFREFFAQLNDGKEPMQAIVMLKRCP